MRVLITRAEPAASRTAGKLITVGHDPVLCPIFELADTGGPDPKSDAEHYIFTSANALEVLSKRGWKPDSAESIAWCVGARTETAAKAIGFAKTRTASGGGARLAAKITADELTKSELFVYPTTPDRSFDMVETLAPSGITVEAIDVYETAKIIPDTALISEFFDAPESGAIFIFSERSAGHLLDILKNSIELNKFGSVSVISISQSAANIMLNCPWQGVYVSEHPDEMSMISRLQEISNA